LNDFEKLGGAAHTCASSESHDLQEKESSANGCLMLRKSVESNGRSISRGELRSHAPRAMKLDQAADAAIAAAL
jgi:hypothetical protein